MQIIRRLYFYAVTLVSLETVIWGLIGLMRTVFSAAALGATADRLAAPLAFILVGLPVFLVHWRIVQGMAAENADEAASRIRAAFFYIALATTFFPAAQNALALLSRSLTEAFGVGSSQALLGSGQTLADNAVAVGVNLLLAAYLFRRNQQNWSGEICAALSEQEKRRLHENYADARRLYRYLWLGYSLAFTVLGVRQLLVYLLRSPLGFGASSATLANGLALLAVGLPIWFATQRIIDHSLTDSAEAFSWLRVAFLYAVTWVGMFLTLYQLGKIGDLILRLVFGESLSLAQSLHFLRPAIALGVPLGVVWGWYGRQRQEAVRQHQTPLLQNALERFHATIVVSAALVAILLGSSRLLASLINPVFRGDLSASLATLAVAIPVWLRYWHPLQQEAAQAGEAGDHARRSLVRKAMLYVWIFIGVVGTMFATGIFLFEILRAFLGTPIENLALDSLLRLRLTLIFLVLLIYHILTLRRDQRLAAASLAARQADYPVIIWLARESQLGKELADSLHKEASHLPIFWVEEAEQPSQAQWEQAKALVISSRLLETSSENRQSLWQTFAGQQIVIPDSLGNWYWVGGSAQRVGALARQTARALRLLAEGQELPRQSGTPLLTSIAYVLATLFLLQLLQFGLVILFISMVPFID